SSKIAKKMIDAVCEAGADAVKFQSFQTEKMVTKSASKAKYQLKATGSDQSQYEMIKKLELDKIAHRDFLNYCRQKKIMFLSSPFDLESVDLLDSLGMKIFKIPSGEITNLPYLRKIGRLKKKVILSTGMADLKEIRDSLNVLIKAGTAKNNITVLHCHTDYPTVYEDVNLLAMLTIKNSFDVRVGYSDHTLGYDIAIAAAALGASVIEKHFTLDRNMPGPDHKASLEPREIKNMVQAVRNVEKALGCGEKKPSISELKNKLLVRKSIVAAKKIFKGETFTNKNVTVKRPGAGIGPMAWDKVIGQTARFDFEEDSFIKL
ncbi:MAG: N-acetylneuraminate synthase, partial [Candidatus Omnitrophica bacterium]|nr:N-acetylneuraminate synthase [Candidatus Omnitrophota bacterium]